MTNTSNKECNVQRQYISNTESRHNGINSIKRVINVVKHIMDVSSEKHTKRKHEIVRENVSL
jgi:hypothetical protein